MATGADRWVVGLQDVDAARVALTGGKGAGLAELVRIDGVDVPPGFCVTTRAFRGAIARAPSIEARIARLAHPDAGDPHAIGALCAELRDAVENLEVPEGVAAAISGAVADLGVDGAYAVRSSATAEDSASASFAGQHDTTLDVVGTDAILRHVRRCWASLFTERAVAYRLRHGIDHRDVQMAVVVQRMVRAEAAGVLFTADPVTSNRRITAVEAIAGLGEALVSGRVVPDRYAVRDDAVTVVAQHRARRVLNDAQVLRLARLGRRIETQFGRPQDVEWCLAGDDVAIVQSRPITTLFPIPDADDAEHHVYVSVGHQQMMTDAMKPLGLSVFQLTALPRMDAAGGRLFVDIAPRLASPASRAAVLQTLGTSDPLLGDALQTLIDRGDIVPAPAGDDPTGPAPAAPPPPTDADPAIVAALIQRSDAAVAALARDIDGVSGPALFDFILADIAELKRLLSDPLTRQAIMAGMEAAWWLNAQLAAWLGEQNAADALSQSVRGNVTAEMGLALMDVADVIRPHREVVAFLEQVEDDDFLDALDDVPGGPQARAAIEAYLDAYGMRCVGEIDITRPRWIERPGTLVPVILANVAQFEPGAAARRFERGLRRAHDKERDVLERLRALPDGEQKAAETKRMIDRVRAFAGYREHPKYGIVSRYLLYKRALLREAERLVATGALREPGDSFYLTFQELREAVRRGVVDDRLVAQRKREFRSFQALTPPRLLTSDGEVVRGSYRRDDVPAGALSGLAVSGGTVEGRARVVLDMADARLDPGDILVTPHTDPSWSPLFVGVAGLVTEVGGLMTHGAVIAREYGLPAVVGVEHATTLIGDGRRIRVHGTAGYVEILSA